MATLRAYQPSDAPALRQVFYSAIHGTVPRYYTMEQADAWAPKLYDADHWAERMAGINPFVAEVDGPSDSEKLVVAYADVQQDGYIDHFFVSAPYAGQGIGNRLMQAIHA